MVAASIRERYKSDPHMVVQEVTHLEAEWALVLVLVVGILLIFLGEGDVEVVEVVEDVELHVQLQEVSSSDRDRCSSSTLGAHVATPSQASSWCHDVVLFHSKVSAEEVHEAAHPSDVVPHEVDHGVLAQSLSARSLLSTSCLASVLVTCWGCISSGWARRFSSAGSSSSCTSGGPPAGRISRSRQYNFQARPAATGL